MSEPNEPSRHLDPDLDLARRWANLIHVEAENLPADDPAGQIARALVAKHAPPPPVVKVQPKPEPAPRAGYIPVGYNRSSIALHDRWNMDPNAPIESRPEFRGMTQLEIEEELCRGREERAFQESLTPNVVRIRFRGRHRR